MQIMRQVEQLLIQSSFFKFYVFISLVSILSCSMFWKELECVFRICNQKVSWVWLAETGMEFVWLAGIGMEFVSKKRETELQMVSL